MSICWNNLNWFLSLAVTRLCGRRNFAKHTQFWFDCREYHQYDDNHGDQQRQVWHPVGQCSLQSSSVCGQWSHVADESCSAHERDLSRGVPAEFGGHIQRHYHRQGGREEWTNSIRLRVGHRDPVFLGYTDLFAEPQREQPYFRQSTRGHWRFAGDYFVQHGDWLSHGFEGDFLRCGIQREWFLGCGDSCRGPELFA